MKTRISQIAQNKSLGNDGLGFAGSVILLIKQMHYNHSLESKYLGSDFEH